MATRRQELPTTFSRFRAGELSSDQVTLIARYCPPEFEASVSEFEASVSEFAVAATIPQLAQTLKNYCWPKPDQPTPEQPTPEQQRNTRSCALTTSNTGDFTLRVTGDAEEGHRIRAALQQSFSRVKEHRGPGDDGPVTQFDAFMALIDSGADADLSVSRHNRHKALLHLEATDLADWANGLNPRLHLGPLITDELMELLTCDAAVQLVVTEFGSPVRLGRSTPTIPAWLRHLVMHRDNGFRLCGATVGLDADHLIHWSKGGPTDPSNLVTLCARHHTLLHKGEFVTTGDPEHVPGPTTDDGLVFRNHHGLKIRPPTPHPAARPPNGTYRRPTGERLDKRSVIFSPTS